jgi:myeloid leukemia factor 1
MLGAGGGSSPFTVVSQSYMSTQKVGPDGRIVHEKFMNNGVSHRGGDGHVISEHKQAYRNSNGIDRIGHERRLDDRGRKVVKERNRETNEEEETNHFHNMDYDDVAQFDSMWGDMGNRVGLHKFGGYLDSRHMAPMLEQERGPAPRRGDFRSYEPQPR